MKIRILIVMLMVVLLIPVMGLSQSTIFAQIKGEVIKSAPDADGDYIIGFQEDDYFYALGYMGKRQIGCVKRHIPAGTQVIVIYDEIAKNYGVILIQHGNEIIAVLETTENEATKFANEVFNKVMMLKTRYEKTI